MIRVITTAIVAIFSAGALLHLAQAQFQVGTKKSVSLTGVNIAGADFGDKHLPDVFGQNYFYPKPSSIDYFATKGMNIIRLPVPWERLQHHLGENLDEKEMQRIDAVLEGVAAIG
jgi:aryl-phospho-beta-D-glucosidase BglC (GH1 family)